MSKMIQFCLLGTLSIVAVACVPTPSENTAAYLDSASVTQNIQNKLVSELGSQGLLIKVRAYRDEVLLSGIVNSPTIKQKAGEIAASVGDIKLVRNDIRVK